MPIPTREVEQATKTTAEMECVPWGHVTRNRKYMNYSNKSPVAWCSVALRRIASGVYSVFLTWYSTMSESKNIRVCEELFIRKNIFVQNINALNKMLYITRIHMQTKANTNTGGLCCSCTNGLLTSEFGSSTQAERDTILKSIS